MPESALAERLNVELVNVGSWRLLSGSWEPNRKDILAAVEASKCPAVRRPRLKLGHLDPRFNTVTAATHDGTPSLGWFDNLRSSADGNTLIGDQVALPWLDRVQAAAWPDRSIEGTYRKRCALGHVHDFVIDAVALLGETPPGIPTLKSIKSLAELPEALGVAAGADVEDSGEHVEATVRAAAAEHTSAVIMLVPAAEDAERLAVDGGEPAEELHVTLAYLGEAANLGAAGQQDVIDAVSSAANGLPEITADIFSVAAFNPPGAEDDDGRDRTACLAWGLSGDLIDAVHTLISEALWAVDTTEQHQPWHCHMTAVFSDDLGKLAQLATRVGPVRFDRIRIAFAGQHLDIPLIGEPEDLDDGEPDEVTAAAGDGDEFRTYWLGEGAKRWVGKKHPWTTLYRLLLKKVKNADKAKRITSSYYLAHFGHSPNAKAVKASGSAPILPAAEPEPNTTQEDNMPLSDEMRSRLGLADDADETAALAAIDALKTAAETKPEPTPEMVAASAAATEKAEKAEEAQAVMKEELAKVRSELDTIKASAATTVKASAFDGWLATGRLKPADREVWEGRYDRDPQMVTEILGGRGEGSEVPVMASGTTGSPEPTGEDTQFEADYARIFGADEKASA